METMGNETGVFAAAHPQHVNHNRACTNSMFIDAIHSRDEENVSKAAENAMTLRACNQDNSSNSLKIDFMMWRVIFECPRLSTERTVQCS